MHLLLYQNYCFIFLLNFKRCIIRCGLLSISKQRVFQDRCRKRHVDCSKCFFKLSLWYFIYKIIFRTGTHYGFTVVTTEARSHSMEFLCYWKVVGFRSEYFVKFLFSWKIGESGRKKKPNAKICKNDYPRKSHRNRFRSKSFWMLRLFYSYIFR